jgi:thiol-disulfide isomerase/thioredoxin
MKIKRIILLTCFSFFATIISAQEVKLMSLNQLDKRIELGKDTVYVVNFWATWCTPCVKEIPSFDKLNITYKNAPLKVLLVSVDFKSKLEKVVIPFVKRNHLESEVYLLNEKSEQDYIDRISKNWAGSLPATLVINKKKNTRNFYEQEFTWEELEKVYLENK